MLQFTKLRINGFKSFVDQTEFQIAPGLNGIVGPNGCGKSNIVEALRWVMGESSAKRMRGGGMEDVIFNGTDKRSKRNIAEVSLLLDNSARTAPAAYNNTDEIEITRRIERDHGSNYKINGKNVRARDVQMLFADTDTGANSPAMVSQGRVTKIIDSKPLDRRLILEESAGISGLYARRHEAELRLKAADRNLVRIEDILGSMEERLKGLKRQSRQATRYRNVSTQIRQFEILVAYMEWKALTERLEETKAKFDQAETEVAEKLGSVTQLTKTQNAQSEEIAPLREAEAEAAATLQTQKLALQRLEDETARLGQLLEEAQAQLQQTDTDKAHEEQTLSESTEILEKLETEQKRIIAEQDNEGDKLSEKQEAKDELESKVIALEEQYTALMQGEAESKARKQSLEQQIQTNSERLETVKTRKAKAKNDLDQLSGDNENTPIIKELENKIKNLEDLSNKIDEDLKSAQTRAETIQQQVQEARTLTSTAETKKSKFDTEIEMLERFFEEENEENFSAVLDDVNAETGFEKALSRALGDTLLASVDEAAPARWFSRTMTKDLPKLPEGVKALLPYVKAPKELHLALSQIGIVGDEQTGDRLIHNLLPGQSLVSKAGTYWRWDGYSVKAEAADRNALHLEQKSKLRELEAKRPQISDLVEKAQTALEKVLGEQKTTEEELKKLQEKQRATEAELTHNRAAYSEMREGQVRHDTERAHLGETITNADEDIKTLEEIIAWDKDRLKAYEQETTEKQSEDTEKVKQTLSEARDSYNAAIRAFDTYQQEQNSRKARLHAIADERINIQNRAIRARERLKDLEERNAALTNKVKDLKNQPKDFEDDKEKLLSTISELEEKRNQAAEKLAAAETEVGDTGRALKEAESNLSETRETRASAQATLDVIQEQQEHMEANIREQFDMPPQDLAEHAALDMEKDWGDLEAIRTKKEKLTRERDNIGPVNLRADEEAVELEKEVTTLVHERNDLIQAIEELRGGINKINKEARERLLAAFDHVNAHFQELFTRLFAGGKAHLALIDDDDPLGAGLEIFAQPPGKTLQSLSLLSGGEQTLASIALIFAMFLTNPSPICVLDEIDAPLDDANVDRVCDLLEELAERGETRFVIITHHRMTMARMDMLYGVTMAERGISQLVSVDLQQSFDFLEAA